MEEDALEHPDVAAALTADAQRAAVFLKSLSNPNRLIVLCMLCEGEKTVGAMERALGIRQPALSQQLARLRQDGLVATRREGKTVHYRLASEEARLVIGALYTAFCGKTDGR